MAAGPLAETFLENRLPLLRYLRARGAADEAEDVLQELWLKLDGDHLAGVVDVRAYLYRMAHNLMLDRRRSASRRRRREEGYHREGSGADGEADPAPTPDMLILARDKLRHIERSLTALGPRTDFIFRRFRVEGVPQRDIAAELGITVSAVEKHLQKAYRAVAVAQQAYLATSDAPPLEQEAIDGGH